MSHPERSTQPTFIDNAANLSRAPGFAAPMETASPGVGNEDIDEILRRIQDGESWSSQYGFENGPMLSVREVGATAVDATIAESDVATAETIGQPENVSKLQSMLSDEGLQRQAEFLDDQQRGEYDAATGRAYRLMQRAKAVEEKYIENGTLNGKEATYQQVADQQNQIVDYARRTFGVDAVKQYYMINSSRNMLDKGNVELWGDAAAHAYDKLTRGTKLLDDGVDREAAAAPALQHEADRQTYVDYLQKKPFIRHEVLKACSSAQKVLLDIEPGQTISVPLSNVVNASNFESWAGRNVAGEDVKQRDDAGGKKDASIDVIMDYASRETDIPPVEGIDAYIQPDGTVLFSVPQSNHRTAAAIARGQTELAVAKNIAFHMLDRNLVEQQQLHTA